MANDSLTSNEQLRATAQQMLNDGYSHMLVDPLDILRLTAEPPPTLIPAPDLSEHIAWLREHIERLNALRDHLACRASEPPSDPREERLREAFLKCRQMLATHTGTFYNAAHFGLSQEDIGMERATVTKNVLHCPHDSDPDDCMHCADRQPDETSAAHFEGKQTLCPVCRSNYISGDEQCDH